MPLITTKGAASAQGFGEFSASADPVYIEQIFSTYLYTGNSTSGGTQTITNNIDLTTKGGLVWIKGRSAASNHILTDTARGVGASATDNNALASNLTSAQDLGGSSYDFLSAFSTTGFTVKQGGTTTATRGTNYDAVTYASWTFRKQAKFFDVVTWTGDDAASKTISHSLGSVPGCIIAKITSASGSWWVYHRSASGTPLQSYLRLELTSGTTSSGGSDYWGATSTSITVNSALGLNGGGQTYVAYLFAHDAGGFGLSGTDNVISCGSFSVSGSDQSVNLGYEPQWVLLKNISSASDWVLTDTMRGMPVGGADANLRPNNANAEGSFDFVDPTATGFVVKGASFGVSGTGIYIAIRRGPMKVPTTGTSVFSPVANNNSTGTKNTTNFPVDMQINTLTAGDNRYVVDRLRGVSTNSTAQPYELRTNDTAQENTTNNRSLFWDNTGFQTVAYYGGSTAFTALYYNFRRAPGFFDVVCYTQNFGAMINHNLCVVPELIIYKNRSNVDGVGANWKVTSSLLNSFGTLNSTDAWGGTNTVSNTTTTFWDGYGVVYAGQEVAYLFATCAGVSKVGSYTGTGTTKQIDCGFTGGARFVLIKRTDSTGNWLVADSARGIVSGNDPLLYLNSTAAEITTLDWIDADSSGFVVNQEATANANVNGATYIFLAVA